MLELGAAELVTAVEPRRGGSTPAARVAGVGLKRRRGRRRSARALGPPPVALPAGPEGGPLVVVAVAGCHRRGRGGPRREGERRQRRAEQRRPKVMTAEERSLQRAGSRERRESLAVGQKPSNELRLQAVS